MRLITSPAPGTVFPFSPAGFVAVHIYKCRNVLTLQFHTLNIALPILGAAVPKDGEGFCYRYEEGAYWRECYNHFSEIHLSPHLRNHKDNTSWAARTVILT